MGDVEKGHPDLSEEPYAFLYINDTQVLTNANGDETMGTGALDACYTCNFERQYTSQLITKDVKIKIEVKESDTVQDDLIISSKYTEDTVENYLKYGIKFGLKQNYFEKLTTYIETASFWSDEYEEKPILDVFLAEHLRKNSQIEPQQQKTPKRPFYNQNQNIQRNKNQRTDCANRNFKDSNDPKFREFCKTMFML